MRIAVMMMMNSFRHSSPQSKFDPQGNQAASTSFLANPLLLILNHFGMRYKLFGHLKPR